MSQLVSHRRRWWLYLLAALLIAYLVVPVFIVVPMSFSASRFLEFPPSEWSLRWYVRFFQSVDWYSSMLVSLEVATVTTLIAVPMGVAAAYALHASKAPLIRRLHPLLMLPLMVPNMIIAIGVFYLYVRWNWVGTFRGLVAAHLMLAIPMVVVTCLSGLQSFDMAQELVARSLGCSRWYAFRRITLPQIRNSLVIGALFAFITSFDEVVIALFVARGGNITITKVMFDTLHDEIDPTIAAASSMLIVGSILIAALAVSMTSRLEAATRRARAAAHDDAEPAHP